MRKSWVLYILLVPYLLHPKHSSFFIIFVMMETKALEQSHFKYYTEVKELQKMYSKTSARKFTDPSAGNALLLIAKPSEYWSVVCLLIWCFLVQLHVTSHLFYHVNDVRFICLLVNFSPFPHKMLMVWERKKGRFSPFNRETVALYTHCFLPEAVPEWTLMEWSKSWGCSKPKIHTWRKHLCSQDMN